MRKFNKRLLIPQKPPKKLQVPTEEETAALVERASALKWKPGTVIRHSDGQHYLVTESGAWRKVRLMKKDPE